MPVKMSSTDWTPRRWNSCRSG